MTFAKNSRYAMTPTITVKLADGRSVTAIKLRRLSTAAGRDYTIHAGDRLDLLAHRHLGDATAHWKIADANTELDGAELCADVGRVITLPEE